MGVHHFVTGYETFEIEADDKIDAVRKGKLYVLQHPIYGSGGNYDTNDVKCIKKLNVKKKGLK